MSRLRFALLDASHSESTRRNFRREVDADLVEFAANDGDLPDGFAFDGVIITGSRVSVYDDEEWIPPLVEYVGAAADRGLPTLGVCYGHQVLAEALGGRVAGMGEYEIGYRSVERVADDPLFEGVDEEFTVFTTHQDAVVDLPPGADLLAENDYGVHAFRKGHCWGVQFHPEYDVATAERIAKSKEEYIGAEGVREVLGGITEENYAAACEAKRLFDNFRAYAADRRRADGAEVGTDTAAD
ncbi:MAG: type 1 glutamine amidotransferase [Haloferacaceae archaeon]